MEVIDIAKKFAGRVPLHVLKTCWRVEGVCDDLPAIGVVVDVHLPASGSVIRVRHRRAEITRQHRLLLLRRYQIGHVGVRLCWAATTIDRLRLAVNPRELGVGDPSGLVRPQSLVAGRQAA